ncbi:MAG: ribonuclease P protein component 4 [Nanoarchaeota archaeon]|nr:ribonuclease P protein component 4 [Nanoarchaeota archaeon]
MKRIFHRIREKNKAIARERITKLFARAEEVYKEHHELANRYVSLARKIQMKYRVRIPAELRKKFCKHCLHFLVPSKNCRVRLQKNHIVYYCLDCKKFTRFVHKGSKNPKKKAD